MYKIVESDRVNVYFSDDTYWHLRPVKIHHALHKTGQSWTYSILKMAWTFINLKYVNKKIFSRN